MSKKKQLFKINDLMDYIPSIVLITKSEYRLVKNIKVKKKYKKQRKVKKEGRD